MVGITERFISMSFELLRLILLCYPSLSHLLKFIVDIGNISGFFWEDIWVGKSSF